MAHLPQFIANHWLLCLALVIVLLLILLNEWRTLRQAGTALEPYQVVHKINRDDAIILDIRSRDSFSKGHIINAVHTSQTQLTPIEKFKDKEVIIVCESGTEANQFSQLLKKNGFNHVNVLKGGMTAWRQAELPTT